MPNFKNRTTGWILLKKSFLKSAFANVEDQVSSNFYALFLRLKENFKVKINGPTPVNFSIVIKLSQMTTGNYILLFNFGD